MERGQPEFIALFAAGFTSHDRWLLSRFSRINRAKKLSDALARTLNCRPTRERIDVIYEPSESSSSQSRVYVTPSPTRHFLPLLPALFIYSHFIEIRRRSGKIRVSVENIKKKENAIRRRRGIYNSENILPYFPTIVRTSLCGDVYFLVEGERRHLSVSAA